MAWADLNQLEVQVIRKIDAVLYRFGVRLVVRLGLGCRRSINIVHSTVSDGPTNSMVPTAPLHHQGIVKSGRCITTLNPILNPSNVRVIRFHASDQFASRLPSNPIQISAGKWSRRRGKTDGNKESGREWKFMLVVHQSGTESRESLLSPFQFDALHHRLCLRHWFSDSVHC